MIMSSQNCGKSSLGGTGDSDGVGVGDDGVDDDGTVDGGLGDNGYIGDCGGIGGGDGDGENDLDLD